MASQHMDAMQRLQRVHDAGGLLPPTSPSNDQSNPTLGSVSDAAGSSESQQPSTAIKQDRVGRIVVWIFGFYLIGKIFYIFGGGTAQPADIVLAGLGLIVVSPAAFWSFLKEEMMLTLLTLWIIIVNLTWAMMTARFDFVVSNLYYLFNIIIVVAALSARWRQMDLFDRIIPWMIFASIAFETVAVIGFGHELRAIGTFRNPNQLAYWGIIVLSLLLVLRKNKPQLIDIPFMIMVLYCEIAAASRAGLISTIVLIMMWSWFYMNSPLKKVLAMTLGGLLIVGFYSSSGAMRAATSGAETSTVGSRFENDSQDGGQIEERNYDRLYRFYQYTLVGSGEGYISRFVRNGQANMEIHSTFGTLLFSYGVPGLMLFILFSWSIFQRLQLQYSMYLIPSLIYGITHQGLRFTLFWALVGVMLSVVRQEARARGGQSHARRDAILPPPRRARGIEHLAEIAARR